MSGGAVGQGCEALIPRFVAIGAHLMQCATSTARFENGKVVGPQASVTLEEIAAAWYHRPDRLPPDVDLGGLRDHHRVQGPRATAVRSATLRTPPWSRSTPRSAMSRFSIRDRRGLRNPGQPDGGRRPDLGRRDPGARHGAVRGKPLRRQRPAAGLDLRRLSAARSDRDAAVAQLPISSRRRPTPSSASRAWARAARSRRRRWCSTRSTTRCGRSALRSLRRR